MTYTEFMIAALPLVKTYLSSDLNLDRKDLISSVCKSLFQERLPQIEEVTNLVAILNQSSLIAIPTRKLSSVKLDAFNLLNFLGLTPFYLNFSILEIEAQSGSIPIVVYQQRESVERVNAQLQFALNLISFLVLLPKLDSENNFDNLANNIETICDESCTRLPSYFEDSEWIELRVQSELQSVLTDIIRSWSISNTISFLKKLPYLSSSKKTSIYRRMDILQNLLLTKADLSLEDLAHAIFPSYQSRLERMFELDEEELTGNFEDSAPIAPILTTSDHFRFRALSFSSINNSPLPSPMLVAGGCFFENSH